MSQRPAVGPRPGLITPGTGGAWATMGLCFAAVLLGLIVWLGGHIASLYTGHGWTGPAPTADNAIILIKQGTDAFWPQVPVNLVWGISGGIALVLFFIGVYFYARWSAKRPLPGDPLVALAGERDVPHLTPRGVAAKAVKIRACLKGVDPRRVPPKEAGLLLGRLKGSGTEVRASWEDVVLSIMAPRAGKTSSAVGQVLDAPGAVLATSNKADLVCLTAELRATQTGQKVWIFDPQQVACSKQELYWNPLRGVDRVQLAQRLASQFSIAMRGERSGNSGFWISAAEQVLTAFFLAAGSTNGDFTLEDVHRWLSRPSDPMPVQLLREYGHRPTADALAGHQAGAVETREGVWATARTMAGCLGDPQIMRWVTPPKRRSPLVELKTAQFAASKQTLYLMAEDSVAGGAGPLVAAFADRIMRDAIALGQARGGRLDPPLVAVLDEMCNLPVADLPSLYSHLGSRSIVPVGIAQSWSQIVGVWGQTAAEALWGAATVKLIGAGIDESRFLEELSKLVGDHDVDYRSLQYGQKNFSQTLQVHKQRIMPPERLRELRPGSAIVLATGCKPAMVDIDRWFDGSRRDEIEQANERALAALTTRASL